MDDSNKLKDMISRVVDSADHLEPSIIARRVNLRFEGIKVTEKQVEDFLQSEYYNDEFKILEKRLQKYDGGHYY